MDIKNYNQSYFEAIFEVVHHTIEAVYPNYYPRSAVDFFHQHHSKENMAKQLPDEFTLVLTKNDTIVGVGTLRENEMKRLFILPEYQGKGYGKIILNELEKHLDKEKYDKVLLDASLGAVGFYIKNDYFYKNYKTIRLSDGCYVCYLEMAKEM